MRPLRDVKRVAYWNPTKIKRARKKEKSVARATLRPGSAHGKSKLNRSVLNKTCFSFQQTGNPTTLQ
jgi:hypothetical protein